MTHHTNIAKRISHAARRWLPGTTSIAAAAAGAGDPAPLLDLQAAEIRADTDTASAE